MSDRSKNLPKSRIEKLDRVLARDPDAFAARFERAGLHREQGAYEAAKQDYLELLRRRPTDFGVLNDFGNLVLKAGYKDAARSLCPAIDDALELYEIDWSPMTADV